MSDGNDQYDEFCVLQATDDPEIAHPIPPETLQPMAQGMAEIAWIERLGNAIFKIRDDVRSDLAAQPIKIVQRARVVFNGPGQGAYALRRWKRKDVGSLTARLRSECPQDPPDRIRSHVFRLLAPGPPTSYKLLHPAIAATIARPWRCSPLRSLTSPETPAKSRPPRARLSPPPAPARARRPSIR